MLSMLDEYFRYILKFSYFSHKIGLHILKTSCIKCQAYFLGKISSPAELAQSGNGSQRVLLFLRDEVLRPSHPIEVMLSAVSLHNHTFTGQG